MGRWDGRLKTIAGLIPSGSTVLDIGAGDGALERLLKAPIKYDAVDKEPQTRKIRRWDAETRWPFDQKHYYDYAVLSGVLEYVKSPHEVLLEVVKRADKAIVSYDHAGSLVYREGLGFKSHLSRAGIEREFALVGWRYKVVATYKHQIVYELQI